MYHGVSYRDIVQYLLAYQAAAVKWRGRRAH